jgi:type III restriction enzyme
VRANTRKMLLAGKNTDPFKETEADMVSRVLRGFSGRGSRARSSCSTTRPTTATMDKPAARPSAGSRLCRAPRREDKARNEDARVWFKGLQAIDAKVGVKRSSTCRPPRSTCPVPATGGLHLPVGGQRLLADGRDRVGHRQGPPHPRWTTTPSATSPPTSTCGSTSARTCPSGPREGRAPRTDWVPPLVLEGALRQPLPQLRQGLRSTGKARSHSAGEPPPVMIVVCPNTTVSKLVFDWIAGTEIPRRTAPPSTSPAPAAACPTWSTASGWTKPRTVLIDSAAARVGRHVQARVQGRRGHRARGVQERVPQAQPRRRCDKLTDEDLMREVMNTVGKPGKLGEQIRCVVSVSCSPRAGMPTRSATSWASGRSAASCCASRWWAVACAAAATP